GRALEDPRRPGRDVQQREPVRSTAPGGNPGRDLQGTGKLASRAEDRLIADLSPSAYPVPGHEGGTAADSHTIPGTLVEVFGHGVLLTGASGTGKSETALGLLDRGHRLVADDAVTVQPTAQGALGACPPPLHGLLSLRDLGIVDVA